MKMKYLNILLMAVVGAFMTSCVDLDRYPLEELSDQSYWKSASDAEKAVSELYNYLPETSQMMDETQNSDDAIHGIKWMSTNVAYGTYDPADFSWDSQYAAIRIANLVIEKTAENINDDDYKAVIGEAYFFRAYEYWTLIRNFGRVPYIDHPLELSEQNDVAQSERADVLEKVYADYEKAASLLPEEWSGSDFGRVTKGAALGMESRAALYYGDYQKALSCAKAVQALGVYDLYRGDYADLFREASDGNNERMLIRNFEEGLGTWNQYHIGFESFPTIGWGGIDPTQSLVDAFECTDGKSISESPLYDPTDPFKNRDPRLEVAVLHDGETYSYQQADGGTWGPKVIHTSPAAENYPQGIGTHGDATATGYYQQKWLDPTKDPQDDNQGWDCGMDATIMRYAEILLTIAECENELNGPTTAAYQAINAVRERVGMPDLPTGLSKEQFRARVRNEWRVEMCMEEGLRQWDLRRWGIAKDIYNDASNWYGMSFTENADGTYTLYTGAPYDYYGQAPGYSDNNYIYPIPQTEMDLNSNLVQNEGY